MITVIASTGTMLALNLLFVAIALAVGFAAGVWFVGPGSPFGSSKSRGGRDRDHEMQLAAERAMMASQRIQDLAKTMAADVGSHADKVEGINTDLIAFAANHGEEDTEAVISAIGQIIDANNELQQRLVMAEKQIEAQTAELQSYESEARTDSLTGLANRRVFDDEMQRQLAEWQRSRRPFSLMIVDIDHFKQFNDQHGHPAGDEVLRVVGSVLVKTARQMDVPCRYGGEEFAVILPGTELREARAVAERFRKAIEARVVNFEGKKLSVTSSIGLAQVTENDDELGLIRRADIALYKSKEAGRNCGHFHDGQTSLPVVGDVESDVVTRDKQQVPNSEVLFDRLVTQDVFLEVLQRRVTESHRFGIPLSVIHLRIVDYPIVRQKYGKSVADMMLESVAQFTQSALRQMDLLGRLDDGEFVALLPGSTFSEGAQVGKRLQTSAANCCLPIDNQKAPLKLSHGIAQLRPNETGNLLVARAKASALAEPAQVEEILSWSGGSGCE